MADALLWEVAFASTLVRSSVKVAGFEAVQAAVPVFFTVTV